MLGKNWEKKKKKDVAPYALFSLKVALSGTVLVFDNSLNSLSTVIMFLFLKVTS